MNASMLTASHYGVVHFGDLDCEAVVLTTGERGYVRKELAKLLGFHESHKGGRFARFLAEIAPNSLSLMEKSSGPILLPSGRQTQWLSDQGLAHLESQIHAVTAIARSSMSYPDFKRRCEAAFAGAAMQLGLLLDELEEGA